MSGSDSSPSDTGKVRKDCKSISSRAIVKSPDQLVLQLLSLDDELVLSLQSSRGPIVAVFEEQVLGTVLPSAMIDIIECMDSGTEFIGRIVALDGAVCEILIVAK